MTSGLETATSIESALGMLSKSQLIDLACAGHPAVWAERKRGFTNSALHYEWYDLALRERRLAVVAPREHSKTEVFTVNATAWRSIYQEGTWTYIFALTLDQAKEMKARIDSAIEEAAPHLIAGARTKTTQETIYANYSRVTVAGAGKAVRGSHPDVIIGDDILEEATTQTRHVREQVARWWFGTIGNMGHPTTTRLVTGGRKVVMPPTKVFLVGTPFHREDLLMSMKTNPLYRFRRYSAEFNLNQLVDGLAVEAT